MYNIEFYETIDGISDLWEFLDDLQQKALTNKDTAYADFPVYSASRRPWYQAWRKNHEAFGRRHLGASTGT